MKYLLQKFNLNRLKPLDRITSFQGLQQEHVKSYHRDVVRKIAHVGVCMDIGPSFCNINCEGKEGAISSRCEVINTCY